MPPFAKVLVAVADPAAKADPAVQRAAELAGRTGSALTLFHSLYSPYVAGEQFYSPDALQRDIEAAVDARKAELEQTAATLRARGLAVHVRVRWDYPVHESIVREVVRGRFDLLVVGSRRHGAAARLLLTNTDWQILRLCPCPVLLARTARTYDRPTVLAAVDPLHAHAKPAELDELLLSTGSRLAAALDGTLHVAHFYAPAMQVTAGPMAEMMAVPVELSEQHVREVRRAFDALVAPHAVARERTHLRPGLPVDELPALAAELNADVVVMGVVSRSGLKRLFIGSTAERVIDSLECDVLVVKPSTFRTPVPRRATSRPVLLPTA